MRLLGLDYGDKTIGIALSDELKLIAYALETIKRKSANKFNFEIERLRCIINEYDIGEIVIGLPKNLNNTCGIQCEKTLNFQKILQKAFPDTKIILWDERLSSLAASKNLSFAGVNSFNQKKIIDKMAAVFILQGYLDYLKIKEDKKMDYDNFEDEQNNIIVMFDDDGNEQELFVLGTVEDDDERYLIVSEDLEQVDDEQDVVVLKEIYSDDDENVDYHIVEDDDELERIIDLFENQFDDEDNEEDSEE